MGWKLREGEKLFRARAKGEKFQFSDHFFPPQISTLDSVISSPNYQLAFFISHFSSRFFLHGGNISISYKMEYDLKWISKPFSCQKLYEIVIILTLSIANKALGIKTARKVKSKRWKSRKRKIKHLLMM